MWVKICGNTRLEDCLLAAELGADAVGFVFAEGKRTVTASQVAAITAHLPPSLEKIGVFTTHDAAVIADTARAAGLTGVQLHGSYDPPLIRELLHHLPDSVRILQVVQWKLDTPAHEQALTVAAAVRAVEADGIADAVLIDSCTRQASGGTGKTFDWSAAAEVLQSVRLPVIVAGGLTAGNVAEAVRILAPAGVDVSSGVEGAPGVKNAEAVAAFLAHARPVSGGVTAA